MRARVFFVDVGDNDREGTIVPDQKIESFLLVLICGSWLYFEISKFPRFSSIRIFLGSLLRVP